MSWNILHGGGKRTRAILEAISAQNPDILTLQEFRNSSNKAEMVAGLSDLGFDHQFIPETSSRRDNTVIVVSKLPFEASTFPSDLAGNDGAHIVKANFYSPLNLTLFAAHLPHKKKQLPYFEALLDLPKSQRSEASLIIGDLNCGIPFEDSETKSFYATHLFQQLLRDGWIDTWRSRHPKQREFTWISTKQQNGYRYDHALASKKLNDVIANVSYQHEVRLVGSSDHSALIVDIQLTK